MNIEDKDLYISPADGSGFELRAEKVSGGRVLTGVLVDRSGNSFAIDNGLPNLTWPKELQSSDADTLRSYEDMSAEYDRYAVLPFVTYRANEAVERARMIELMEIRENSKVLEIGCGTGRGIESLLSKLGKGGQLYLQEISPSLLEIARRKVPETPTRVEFSLANGSYIPFPDNYFDAAYHFGGINTFSEIQRCLSELARVVKPGGKVVFGDEGLGDWLLGTEMGQIMANSNPLLKCKPPLHLLPSIAGEVRLQYIMMGAFYVVDFRVLDAPEVPDYHMQIPSARGGSHWTRFHGNLEGVTDEAKQLAHSARKAAGLSMHDWLDQVVRAAALAQLKKSDE